MKKLRLILALFLCAIAISKTAQAAKPNILLLIADDQSWCHTGYMGDPAIKTPTLDRIAREGVVFENAHCVSASCTPSRGALLTGRPIWSLDEGANLYGTLPAKFLTYPDVLERDGYAVGFTGKGWAPGDVQAGGRKYNPAGHHFQDFDAFLANLPNGKPFCFWFGSHHPHRPYVAGSGIAAGIDPSKVIVPYMLPDVPEVRSDVATYLNEIQKFDAECAGIVAALEKAGQLDNTLIVATSDNGMPFPRGKATLYEFGTHMPLAVRWPGHVPAGRRVTDMVSLMDLCPTFLDAAGAHGPAEIAGKSLMPELTSNQSGQIVADRDHVYLGNERHARARPGLLGYPRRGIRTMDFLYLHNYEEDRWPAGNPPNYGEVDPSDGSSGDGLSKDFLLAHSGDEKYSGFFERAFGRQPAEELYDLKADPHEEHNVAGDPNYAQVKSKLSADLENYLEQTGDPRSKTSATKPAFDQYHFYGGSGPYGTVVKSAQDAGTSERIQKSQKQQPKK